MRKLGGSEMIETVQRKLESQIEMIYFKLDEENDKKKSDFDVSSIYVVRCK